MPASELRRFNIEIARCREITRVLVVDDQEFPLLDALARLGFRINFKNDVDTLDEVDSFQIVASDIKGVGTRLGADGAFLIDQIKRRDPTKYVIAFSAGTYDMRNQTTFGAANACVVKGAGVETWAYELDRGLSYLWSPYEIWRRTAGRLLELDVPPQKIGRLEKKFIQSVRDRKGLGEKEVMSIVTQSGAVGSVDVMAGVRGLVAFGANVTTIVTAFSGAGGA